MRTIPTFRMLIAHERMLSAVLLGLALVVVHASPARADEAPEDYAASCTPGTDDTGCWQAAINAAKPNAPQFGTVAGVAGKVYYITDTLMVCNAYNGTIDGHGAILKWKGATNKPMFLVVNGYQMKFTNLTIISSTSSPLTALETAFEFANATSNPSGCSGSVLFSSKNLIEHVAAEGQVGNSLKYGVRFSNRYGSNANNDMSTIANSTFNNVTDAVVSIEHTNAHQHRLIAVNGYGASGNTGCFVDAQTGFFSSVGGFQHNWGKANFCINGAYGPFSITDSNSEGSKRLLLVGNPTEVAGYPVSVTVTGGRFATNGLHSDGKVVSFNRLGTIAVRDLRISGTPPSNVEPSIAVEPGRGTGSSAAATAIVEGVTHYHTSLDADTWDTLIVKSFVDLYSRGNTCFSATNGYMVACATPLRN